MNTQKKIRWAARTIWMLTRWITATLCVRYTGWKRIEALQQEGIPLIFTIWHGHLFSLLHLMPRRNRLSMLVSTSKDGRILATALKKSGYRIIPGSSHRSPKESLARMIKASKNNATLMITVDGPTGPIYKAKRGALVTAQETGNPVVPVAFIAKNKFTFTSWDRFFIPLPFTRVKLIFGTPCHVPKGMDIQHACLNLEKKLNRLSADH